MQGVKTVAEQSEVQRLLQQLVARGMSDTEIGAAIGVPQNTISAWRRGVRRPAQARLVEAALRRLLEERRQQEGG
jgi:hypothetical protein